ncbi:MaoC/PaaZ C-terminal domain-containing protein [Microbaculum marinum]|uniref:MaoC/PaaZ C-terminal domain-containing protein n=1 Tax=Microbaculum marinum TaxID=1764581 RepID=A0AAW9RF97_9HYPH
MNASDLEPVEFAALTRTDFVRYAGASGDFNPLHHDAEFAREAGLPDVMGHGMLSAGLLATALTRWFGHGAIRAYAVRFQTPVWPGDRLVAHGTITGDTRDHADCTVADVELVLSRASGDIVITGTARVLRAGGQDRSEDEGERT